MPGPPIADIVEGDDLPQNAPEAAVRGHMVYINAAGDQINPVLTTSPRFPQGNPNQGVRTTGGIRRGDRLPRDPVPQVHTNHVGVNAVADALPNVVFGQQMLPMKGVLTRIHIRGPEGAIIHMRHVPVSASEPAQILEFGPLGKDMFTTEAKMAFDEGAMLEFWSDTAGDTRFAAIAEGQI